MLKDYLREKKISIYALAKSSGIAYSTVNDIANGRVNILNCKLDLAIKIANALDISIEELCNIAEVKLSVYSKEFATEIKVDVKNKDYYAEYTFEGETEKFRLCPVNEDTAFYIDDISKWTVEDRIIKRKSEKEYGDE